jgi:CRISPR system Cascade subunit CasA
MHNLLKDPILRTRTAPSGERVCSLPEVLALLATADVDGFPSLMPHQRHAWHSFQVQLAAVALHRSGERQLPGEASTWERLLRDLTGGEEPWHLMTEDLTQPAFFQPPVPEKDLKGFKGPMNSPDDIDVLVKSKNHDVKLTRIRSPRPEHWVFALITLQTMEGFLGSGNYGISRMNGGFASRPCVAMTPHLQWSSRFRRDVAVLLESRDLLLEKYSFFAEEDGLALLWLEPWDGADALPMKRLDPYYIEVCRRVRLRADASNLVAFSKPTESPRLAAKDLKGNTGDPWTPTHRKEGSTLTVSAAGFTYDLLRQLLFSADYDPGVCGRPHQRDGCDEALVLASVLVRGQGKTEGLHQRVIPVPPKARNLLASEEGRNRLGELARERVEDAGLLQRKSLRPALLALVQGGPQELRHRDERVTKWLVAFDSSVDDCFFSELWSSVETGGDAERTRWRKLIVHLGREILRDAERSVAIPAARRYRALAAAERVFEGSVFKNFPDIREERLP